MTDQKILISFDQEDFDEKLKHIHYSIEALAYCVLVSYDFLRISGKSNVNDILDELSDGHLEQMRYFYDNIHHDVGKQAYLDKISASIYSIGRHKMYLLINDYIRHTEDEDEDTSSNGGKKLFF